MEKLIPDYMYMYKPICQLNLGLLIMMDKLWNEGSVHWLLPPGGVN